MEDKRNILKDEQPFSYQLIKNNKCLIYFNGEQIKIIQGKEYFKLNNILNTQNDYQIQIF